MGKRKLHRSSFFQCDYTGYPLKNSCCYMPTWPDSTNDAPTSGRLVKKGTYCNWESVAAHAQMQRSDDLITHEQHLAVIDHIHSITGSSYLRVAPSFDRLSHFKGKMGMDEFHRECCAQDGPINVVKITPEGEVLDILVQPNENGQFIFKDYMHKPYQALPDKPMCFNTVRKSRPLRDKELSVWYWADRGLPANSVASNTFKMQLHGDIILTQHSKEHCFLPRERYLSFTKGQFDDQYAKKRRRTMDIPSISSVEYTKVKANMQASLDAYESARKVGAVPPAELSRVMAMPMPRRSKVSITP